MRYVFLIAGDEKRTFDMKKEEGDRIVAAYMKYTEDRAVKRCCSPIEIARSGTRSSFDEA